MTTEAAGAVGGATVDGVIDGVKGVASGVRRGLASGSHSTPAAALTLGALGIAGLVEWPVLVAVGGAALVLRQLNQKSTAQASVRSANSTGPAKSTARSAPAKQTPAKAARSSQPRARK